MAIPWFAASLDASLTRFVTPPGAPLAAGGPASAEIKQGIVIIIVVFIVIIAAIGAIIVVITFFIIRLFTFTCTLCNELNERCPAVFGIGYQVELILSHAQSPCSARQVTALHCANALRDLIE